MTTPNKADTSPPPAEKIAILEKIVELPTNPVLLLGNALSKMALKLHELPANESLAVDDTWVDVGWVPDTPMTKIRTLRFGLAGLIMLTNGRAIDLALLDLGIKTGTKTITPEDYWVEGDHPLNDKLIRFQAALHALNFFECGLVRTAYFVLDAKMPEGLDDEWETLAYKDSPLEWMQSLSGMLKRMAEADTEN